MVARKAYKVYCLKLLVILLFGELPPKKKRMKQLEEHLKKGREVKKQGISSVVGSLSDEEQVYGDVSDMDELMGLSQEALDTANEVVNPTFDLDASLPGGSELEKLVIFIKSHHRNSEHQW